jgi:hypothetical protein
VRFAFSRNVCSPPEAPDGAFLAFPDEYEPSQSLRQCESLSLWLADARGSKIIEPCDLLEAVYACSLEWSKIGTYWRDWSAFEGLLRADCGNVGPRIQYWIGRAEWLRCLRKGRFVMKAPTPELARARREALALARSWSPGQRPTLVHLEHLLYALATGKDSAVAARLLASGLDLGALEEAVHGAKTGGPASA